MLPVKNTHILLGLANALPSLLQCTYTSAVSPTRLSRALSLTFLVSLFRLSCTTLDYPGSTVRARPGPALGFRRVEHTAVHVVGSQDTVPK
jgi:hypothetical protein